MFKQLPIYKSCLLLLCIGSYSIHCMDNNTLVESLIRIRREHNNRIPSHYEKEIDERYTDDDLNEAMRIAERSHPQIVKFIQNLLDKRRADIRHAPLKTQQSQTQQQRSQSAKVQQNKDNTLIEEIIKFRDENNNRWPSHDIAARYTDNDLIIAKRTAEALNAEEIARFIGTCLQDRHADMPSEPQKIPQSQTQQQRSWGTWLSETQQKVQSWWTSPKE